MLKKKKPELCPASFLSRNRESLAARTLLAFVAAAGAGVFRFLGGAGAAGAGFIARAASAGVLGLLMLIFLVVLHLKSPLRLFETRVF